MLHKPVLQALVLADNIYVDASTGKKIIAGTFNELVSHEFPSQYPRATCAYLSLCDCRGHVALELRYVDLDSGEALMQLEGISVQAESPLDSNELIVEIPELPLPHPGPFALEVHSQRELLGSLRLNVREADPGAL